MDAEQYTKPSETGCRFYTAGQVPLKALDKCLVLQPDVSFLYVHSGR